MHDGRQVQLRFRGFQHLLGEARIERLVLHVRADPAAQHASMSRSQRAGSSADSMPIRSITDSDKMQWNAAISWMADATWARVAPPEPGDVDLGGAAQEQFLIHACLLLRWLAAASERRRHGDADVKTPA